MKKLFIPFIALGLLVSCGAETSTKKTEGTTKKEASYSLKEKTTILKWTAYKTTEKKPVGGEFKEVNIKNYPECSSPEKALEGVKFGVPVSSIFTNNDSRDGKLKQFFFGIMKNTEILTGQFKNIEGDKTKGQGIIALTMNDVTCDLPFDYTIEGKEIKISSVMNIRSWKAEDALKSLNDACYELHKGADKISKTWEDVSINASVEYTQN